MTGLTFVGDFHPQPAVVDPSWGRHYLPRELTALCYHAGWRGENLNKAVAIILGESLGYEWRIHTNDDGTEDVGLMQIHMASHPEVTKNDMLVAQKNVDFGYQIYKAHSYTFSAWVSWTDHLAAVFATTSTEKAYKDMVRYAVGGVANYWLETYTLALL